MSKPTDARFELHDIDARWKLLQIALLGAGLVAAVSVLLYHAL